MRTLVTGAAGFIGSHLCEELLTAGHEVMGVDCFTDVYPRGYKEANLDQARSHDRFEIIEADLRSSDVAEFIDGVSTIFHLAAVPGVRASWSTEFRDYVEHNIIATHRLLEAVRRRPVDRFVYASSSSVYGNALKYPTHESDPTHPHSPYGVTKLSAEQLCLAYAGNFAVPAVALRYFSVYGPRQRPDMGIHRIIEAALGHGTFSVFGTGAQVRDVTFVKDVVLANVAAASADLPPGTVLNIAGGSHVELSEIVRLVAELVGRPIELQHVAEQAGDVFRTSGSTELAQAMLRWAPATRVEDGLRRQVEWHRGEFDLIRRRLDATNHTATPDVRSG